MVLWLSLRGNWKRWVGRSDVGGEVGWGWCDKSEGEEGGGVGVV